MNSNHVEARFFKGQGDDLRSKEATEGMLQLKKA